MKKKDQKQQFEPPGRNVKYWTAADAAAADRDPTGDGRTKERINNRDYHRLWIQQWVMRSDAGWLRRIPFVSFGWLVHTVSHHVYFVTVEAHTGYHNNTSVNHTGIPWQTETS